jgi:hypothetical protein
MLSLDPVSILHTCLPTSIFVTMLLLVFLFRIIISLCITIAFVAFTSNSFHNYMHISFDDRYKKNAIPSLSLSNSFMISCIQILELCFENLQSPTVYAAAGAMLSSFSTGEPLHSTSFLFAISFRFSKNRFFT